MRRPVDYAESEMAKVFIVAAGEHYLEEIRRRLATKKYDLFPVEGALFVKTTHAIAKLYLDAIGQPQFVDIDDQRQAVVAEATIEEGAILGHMPERFWGWVAQVPE